MRQACLDASSDVHYLTLNSLIYDIKMIYVDFMINYTIDYMLFIGMLMTCYRANLKNGPQEFRFYFTIG